MITKAIRNLIRADAPIVAQLAVFDFGSGDEAAIFAFDSPEESVPHDATFPAVVIRAAGGINFGDRGNKGARIVMRVVLWGNRERETLEVLATEIWELLDRATLTQAGFNIYGVLADPPAFLDDPDDYPGFLINVNPFVEKI